MNKFMVQGAMASVASNGYLSKSNQKSTLAIMQPWPWHQ